jgi:hypothetical protein
VHVGRRKVTTALGTTRFMKLYCHLIGSPPNKIEWLPCPPNKPLEHLVNPHNQHGPQTISISATLPADPSFSSHRLQLNCLCPARKVNHGEFLPSLFMPRSGKRDLHILAPGKARGFVDPYLQIFQPLSLSSPSIQHRTTQRAFLVIFKANQ